jgi:predicted phage-related endonuclease
MQIEDLKQGSEAWQQFRLCHFGASEAAAMLGLSSKVSRTELLHMKSTGTAQEFSEWVQKNILDYGHEVEAMARPLVEELIGTELYPVTCSDGLLSASCDGLTLGEDVAFEHKQWNAALAESVAAGVLPDEYQPQCQQIMMITGCSKVVFVCSDGTLDNFVHMDVLPDVEWQERIRAGWAQFATDLANYEPKELAEKPQAEQIMALPALTIQIEGRVATSNLPAFRAKAEAFIANIKTELATDEDFANAEATVKFCENAEKELELAKRAALEQTADIADLMRTIDHITAQMRDKRLMLDKLVKNRKQTIKDEILANVKHQFAVYVAGLEEEIAPLRLVFQARDFAGAMKNKRTLATLHDAVDTELANAKIAVDAIAKAVRGRLTWYREHAAGYEFLFADLQTVIQKNDDDFQLAVRTRIDEHKTKEAERAAREQAAAAARAEPVVEQPTPAVEAAPAAAGVTPITAVRVAPNSAPTLRLGQIGERLGFSLTADFLNSLGFAHAAQDKAAKLYHESDFPSICAALCRHITAVAQAQPKAA